MYFTIVGVISHSFPAGDGGESLVMADDLARTYFGATADGFDDLVVTTRGSEATIDATAASYGMQAVPVSVIESDARDALQHSIGLVLAVAIISVLIAMLAVVNTLLVNVRQGTRELALLRAVGLGSRQAMRRVLTEAGLLAGAATLIGVGGRLSHRRADAPGEHHADLCARIRLSRRDRDRAHRSSSCWLRSSPPSVQLAERCEPQCSARCDTSSRDAPRRRVEGCARMVAAAAAIALAACGSDSPSLSSGDPAARPDHHRSTRRTGLHRDAVPPRTSTQRRSPAATPRWRLRSQRTAFKPRQASSTSAVSISARSNGPIDVVATVERFASIGGASSAYGASVRRLDAIPGAVPTSTGPLGDEAHAISVVRTTSSGHSGGRDHRRVARRQPRQHHRRARSLWRDAARRRPRPRRCADAERVRSRYRLKRRAAQLLRGSQRNRKHGEQHRARAPRGHDQQVGPVEAAADWCAGSNAVNIALMKWRTGNHSAICARIDVDGTGKERSGDEHDRQEDAVDDRRRGLRVGDRDRHRHAERTECQRTDADRRGCGTDVLRARGRRRPGCRNRW